MESAADSSLPPAGKSSTHPRGRRGNGFRDMEMSVDSQSFVNLGQLMGSRHGGGGASSAATSSGGETTRTGLEDFACTSFLSDDDDDSEGLRDFDQIFHPAATSTSGARSSGRELYGQQRHRGGGAADHQHGDGGVLDDDNDSVLPALPSRSSTPGSPRGYSTSNSGNSSSSKPYFIAPAASAAGAGWVEDDFGSGASARRGGGRVGHASCDHRLATGGAPENNLPQNTDITTHTKTTPAAGITSPEIQPGGSVAQQSGTSQTAATAGGETAASGSSTPFLRESWLHVPVGDDDEIKSEAAASSNMDDDDSHAEEAGGAAFSSHRHRYPEAAAAAARARRAAAQALGDCGDCLVRGVGRAGALAKARALEVGRAVKVHVDAGADACSRGQKAAVKAVDSVPQAPVRVWLGRVALSIVVGIVLGSAATFCALRAATTKMGSVCAGADATSPWWSTGGAGDSVGAGGADQSFGDRLDKALFAARAGEAAAQQGLLEDMRNILAATGESGGISAEQILRQFNAKRFKEASKAWSAAEGNVAGSDPLDPLFFAPPTAPVNPSASASQQPQPSSSSIPHGATPATDCAGGASGSTFCSADSGGGGGGGDSVRANMAESVRRVKGFRDGGRQEYRRHCGGGGWVC
ncbi:unnamed protein product [Ectocarpus sp. CCAP 1310/34]|nr:unnamed protein product [Ectocarpus sp. CCAP 1310/34]